ncbi:L-serine ammonia-lyase, iron-sulfur-dependent subunit beta [Selenihalanaerobacter shriftii]|uniref:L-serine deaminase n=1 Tax=Selenihalanaerobacter shriftii TaxID=142842 RepID=A0A1T4QSL7_9FIRM|nr:L-serine ammonia-lyase, iron-sulfur-dependent subunit beta [Selenihalanaerobacter shriftii]SKA06258.1 L-serine ammonia-lyase [Selenihalanaerobacter shriftii]
MSKLSAFDTIGPIMVGPSSSHTAGAVRIGNLAREIVGTEFKQIKILLHGSFGKTYRGHGTDKALIGGLLGLSTDDSLIKESFKLAKERGIEFEITPIDLGLAHPNTAKLEIKDITGKLTTIIGSSIGGGNIIITEIDGIKVDLKGEYHTLITLHKDKPGMVAKISGILHDYDLNIAFMKVVRQDKEALATAIIKLNQKLEVDILELIKNILGVELVKVVNPLT